MIFLNQLSPTVVETMRLTAVIDTALCVGAGGSSGSLADKPIVRNAQGQLLIPGSQLKGRLRHECEKFARRLGWKIFAAPTAKTLCPTEEQVPNQLRKLYQVPGYRGYHCLVSQIFGDPILPSRIVVDDLICSVPADELPEVLRPRVTIDRVSRIAEEKKLFLLETSPAHFQLRFEGSIDLLPDCPDYAKPLLLASLRHIHALGGSKSTGLGWLSWENLPQVSPNNPAWLKLLPSAES